MVTKPQRIEEQEDIGAVVIALETPPLRKLVMQYGGTIREENHSSALSLYYTNLGGRFTTDEINRTVRELFGEKPTCNFKTYGNHKEMVGVTFEYQTPQGKYRLCFDNARDDARTRPEHV